MGDHKNSILPPGGRKPGNIGEDPGPDGDYCNVTERMFPCVRKCYGKSDTISGVVYKKTCPYCSIWTSFPNSVSLEVTYIFECTLHGYGKRIKE